MQGILIGLISCSPQYSNYKWPNLFAQTIKLMSGSKTERWCLVQNFNRVTKSIPQNCKNWLVTARLQNQVPYKKFQQSDMQIFLPKLLKN